MHIYQGFALIETMPKADRKKVAKNTFLSKLAHTQENSSGRGLVMTTSLSQYGTY
jgi:hypothetical protein